MSTERRHPLSLGKPRWKSGAEPWLPQPRPTRHPIKRSPLLPQERRHIQILAFKQTRRGPFELPARAAFEAQLRLTLTGAGLTCTRLISTRIFARLCSPRSPRTRRRRLAGPTPLPLSSPSGSTSPRLPYPGRERQADAAARLSVSLQNDECRRRALPRSFLTTGRLFAAQFNGPPVPE